MQKTIPDEVLLALALKNSGGGGGGTSDYESLDNLPKINDITLLGNKTASDLNLIGKNLSGQTVKPTSDTEVTAGTNAEILNDYRDREFNGTRVTAGNVASGNYAHAEGSTTTASGGSSHAEGYQTVASGDQSHSEGGLTTASGSYSHAEGYQTKAQKSYAHSEGDSTTADGYGAHSEGQRTKANSDSSHAEGNSTLAVGFASHAEGNGTTAGGYYSHAEGNSTTAGGNYSHAEGTQTQTTNNNAHAEGNKTKATNYNAHAEGDSTTASGNSSHTEGYNTVAGGNYSHAEGMYTAANYQCQHTQGKYNNNKSNTLFEIGNGESDNKRSNVFEVYQDGSLSQDDGTTKFKFGNNGTSDGYYDKENVFHAFSSGGSAVLTNDITTAIDVGGIEAGTEYEVGTSLETVLRDMLEPTLYPTLTNPSVNLSATGSKLIEYGNTVNTTLTASFNRGSINPAYGTSGYRSGEVVAYTFFGRYDTGERFEQLPNSPNTSGTLSYTVDIPYPDSSHDGKANLFQCFTSVQYSQGEQPKDSKGNDYDNPLPAGSVQSANMSAMTGFLEFWAVNAMWANTANIGTVVKLSLVNNNTTKQRDMVFPAQTVANPEVFDVPASWTVTAVQVKNDLSGAWEDASSQFTVTDTTHPDAGNNTVNYKRYTFNMGVDTGARQIRVKWS